VPISAIAENSRNKKYNQNINYRLKSTPSEKIFQPKISGRSCQVLGHTRRRLPDLPSTTKRQDSSLRVEDYEL
jgi:hypothetical protein